MPAMVGPPPPPPPQAAVPHHHMMMMQADPQEYSRYMARIWLAQYDRDGSLQGFRHYIPHFVLQSFCTTDRLKVQQSTAWYYGEESPNDEPDTLVIYDPQTGRFDKRHWSECFGELNIYERHFNNLRPGASARDQWRLFETVQRLDREIFSALMEPVWGIYQNYQSGMIPIRRGEINNLRKFLFLTTSLRNRDRNQHLLAKDPNMEDARIRRKKFMEAHGLDHPRDLWLQNAELILDDFHFDIATDHAIFDLDREDYRANARERFMVFWEAGPGEEFVLTENAFGCFEGCGLGSRKKLTIEMTAREHEVRTYTRDFMWHQIYVLSPKLVLALCHGTLLNPVLTKAQRRRWGLRRSLLEDLPHPIANNYYKDLAKGEVSFLKQGWEVPPEVEKCFGQPRWDGKVIAIENREQDELVFPVSRLSPQQVSLVNCILLQNQTSTASPVQSVSFRPPTSYRSLYDSLVKFEEISWSKYTDEKQNTYEALEKRLSQYLGKLDDARSNGTAPSARPTPGVFTPPMMTPDPSSDGRGAPKKGEKVSKPETVVTVASELKKERKKPVVPEFSRFEQGLPTPPQTQPQSRESSVPPPPPIPSPLATPRTPSSSMPPPPVQNSRASSSERPALSVLTERPTPQKSRAPSSDRVNTAGSTAATTCEMPTRRATVSSQTPPQHLQQQQEEKRTPSRDRAFSIHDGIRVEPSNPSPMPEMRREQPSRNPSTQSEHRQQQVNAAPPPPPQRASGSRRFSFAHQQTSPPPPPPTHTQDSKRHSSADRRVSEVPQLRVDTNIRSQPVEKKQYTPGTEVPQTQLQPASVPVPEPKVLEKRNVASEKKAESRQSSQSPPARTPSQTPPQTVQITEERIENPKLSPEQLEHIERQRRIERQRAEQERAKAEQERLSRERAEQERIARERAEKERQERQQRAEQERINREREQERLNQERARKRAELERLEQERVKAEQLKAEQERQRIEQQRIEEQRRADQLRLEQEHQRRAEQERRNLEQVRLEQQQIHAQQRVALEYQRKDAYNRSRERPASAHSTNPLAETIRADKARFGDFECQTPSEVSVDSNGSGSSRSSGSSGSGSMPSSKDSDRTERPVKIRGGSASPRRHTITHARDTSFAKFLQVPYDGETVCDVAESMIVEPDDDNEVWVDEGYAEAPQRELELFSKPRKPIVRFASPKPSKMFSPHSPTGGRKATIMALNNKVRYAGHVQHAQGGALHAQHPMHINQPHHNVYPSHREY